ncbi:MAG: glycerate kinase [Actinobacteria bacterium]|nr:glycerate kinase [Actinomycetota bacterium]
MKILVAPDKFKGSLSAKQVASAIKRGIIRAMPDAIVEVCPMADGGEGMAEALLDSLGGERREVIVTGPMGEKVNAEYGILPGGIAVIEMSAAAGLWMVPVEKRNPMLATTYGVGELIKDALSKNIRRIIIGIGGSATNDGGTGMAKALGVRFMDDHGEELGIGGQILTRIRKIDMHGLDLRTRKVEILAACDVTNPLYGEKGAAYVYAPQKGADSQMVRELDDGLRNFAQVIKNDLDVDVAEIPGAGAAGGIGAGLVAFLGARLIPGVEIVAETVGLREKMGGADMVVTAEGRIDSQTLSGKVPFGVAIIAKDLGIPVIAFAGSVKEDAYSLHDSGIVSMFSISDGPISLDESMRKAEELLGRSAEEVFRLMNLKLSAKR